MTFDEAFVRLIGLRCSRIPPGLERDDFVDMPLRHTEKRRQFFLCEPLRRPKQPDRINLIVAVFREIAALSVLVVELGKSRMPVVLSVGGPFQICRRVVGLVAILVVHRPCPIGARADKCFGHDGVYADTPPYVQVNSRVPLLRPRGQDPLFALKRTAILVGDSVAQFLHPSKRRNNAGWFA